MRVGDGALCAATDSTRQGRRAIRDLVDAVVYLITDGRKHSRRSNLLSEVLFVLIIDILSLPYISLSDTLR